MSRVLEARALEKSFGGVKATRNVSFHLNPGAVHAIIGPNGAGKTTLMAQIFGELKSDAGAILFRDRPLDGLSTPARARRGLARSFQITTLAPEMTVREHILLRLLAQRGHAFRFVRPLGAERALQERAAAVLGEHGLLGVADSPAGDLSHGEQRVLELAIAVAVPPELLLLDEPMAGLGAGEGRAFIERLGALKGRFAILLVEHDMGAVFELADWITVLVEGAVAAAGTPQEIREDAHVRAVYLGKE